MRKFTLLTFESHKESLLKGLQKFGDVHFKNLQKDDAEKLEFLNRVLSDSAVSAAEAELEKIKFSLTALKPYYVKPKGLKALTAQPEQISFDEFDAYLNSYDYNGVYESLKAAGAELNAVKDEISRLENENASLSQWKGLDVSPAALDNSKYAKSLIGVVKKTMAEELRRSAKEAFPAVYTEFFGDIKDDAALFAITRAEDFDGFFEFLKARGFQRQSLNFDGVPSLLVAANEKEIARLKAERDGIHKTMGGLVPEYEKLLVASDCVETVLEREKAARNFLKMRTILLIEGWVPEAEAESFRGVVSGVCGGDCYLEEKEVERESQDVPIKLKNGKMVSAFEDVTNMFSLPKYNEIDPTPVIVPFYMLFFGLMVGDAGYGFLMLIATLLVLTVLKPKGKFIRFFFFLSFGVILGGIVYDSVFGYSSAELFGVGIFQFIPVGDGTYRSLLQPMDDVITMLLSSVVLGVVHVVYSLLVKFVICIKNGDPFAAVFDSLSFIVALLTGGGWLVAGFTGAFSPGVASFMQWAFVASMFVIAATQGRENRTVVGKVAGGLFSVYGLTGYLGDVVSYTRISALALSGAYIAFSFNIMKNLMPAGILRATAGSLIFVAGMLINIGLGALGAYVHTSRLHYVEFFGKFYEGGGVPFNAFKIKNKNITINN